MTQRYRGFTLIELMVSVTIMGILLAISIPYFRVQLLDSRLDGAMPHLMQIAAKQRMFYVDTGQYCCSTDNFDEDLLDQGLGLDIDENGDFCFAFVCSDPTKCQNPTSTSFIAPQESGDATIEFEIWAVLRQSGAATISAPRGAQCLPAAGKRPPTGWVRPATDTQPGRETQAVVLRYPPPPNGVDSSTGDRSLTYVWNEGITRTNVLQP